MDALVLKYGGVADFLTIYIAEAHASDEWTLLDTTNAEQGGRFNVPAHQTMDDRLMTANKWVEHLKGSGASSCTYVVDLMDDACRVAHAAWPERLAVVEDGVYVYYGGQGPWGYDTHEVEAWLKARFPSF